MSWALYEAHPHMAQRVPKWQALQDELAPERVLYPGSYTDISPSFAFPDVTYVDMDKRCPKFYADPDVAKRVPNAFRFIHQDYREPLDIEPVDLLLSQFAGPISHFCKGAVRPGGHLLANNSHADAGIAALDPDWELVGIVQGDRVVRTNLNAYLQPKREPSPSVEELIASQKGIAYTKTAPDYLFRRL